jgi:hypothetical protein
MPAGSSGTVEIAVLVSIGFLLLISVLLLPLAEFGVHASGPAGVDGTVASLRRPGTDCIHRHVHGDRSSIAPASADGEWSETENPVERGAGGYLSATSLTRTP